MHPAVVALFGYLLSLVVLPHEGMTNFSSVVES